MAQMRAIVVKDGKGPIENLILTSAPKPVPQPHQVLVKIKAFGLNRMDVMQRQGRYPVPPGASELLGVEFSGTVSELGGAVSGWKVDDEVYGLAGGGAYAEYIAVPQTHIMPKPAKLSWTEAASVPEAWLTAFQALVTSAEIKEGDNVLIHAGASGVGVAANQLARYFKAKTVTTTASTREKLDWLLGLPLGPTHAVNYKEQDFAVEVKRITGGAGIDVLVDFVGKDHFLKNIDALGMDGRMVILALLSGAEVPKVVLTPILYKRLRIQGSTLRARSEPYQADLIAKFKDTVSEHITGEQGNGPLRTYIHEVYPWTEIQAATREMEANANSGKIIVEVV